MGFALLLLAASVQAAAAQLPAMAPNRVPDRAEVEALRARLVQMGADQASGEDRAAGARARLAALNGQDASLSGEIAANRAHLTRLLSALQLMSRDPPPPLLVSPRRANDAIRAAILMRSVAPVLQRRAQALAAQAREIDRIRRQITLQNERLILTESELADRRAAIEKLAREKGALEARLDPASQAAAQKAEAAARGAADPAALVRRLETNPAPLADPAGVAGPVGPVVPAAQSGAVLGAGRLAAPAAGVVVRRWGELLADRRRSEGLAWRTAPLAEVRAPAPARVDYAGPLRGWGQVVVLRVDDHVRLVLTGLDRCDTAAGRSVAAGEPIGLMGRVRNPAPEVYLEVRRDGAPVDPTRWLDGRPGA